MEDSYAVSMDFAKSSYSHESNDNASLFAVFDGHGGSDTSNYLASVFPGELHVDAVSDHNLFSEQGIKNQMINIDLEYNSKFPHQKSQGSTCVLALVEP
jgi:serine/threonine protein phosphatase PrpC